MSSSDDVRLETTDREISLSRDYDAPRELVWRAWTEPAQLVRWWGPQGFRTTTHAHTLAPGGAWRYTMHGPDGRDYENQLTYREIRAPERLVYEIGGVVDVAPVHFSTVVTFEELPGKRTRVTMKSSFPSATALRHVVETYGAIEGGKQHLTRLSEFLPTLGAATGASASTAAAPAAAQAFSITRVFRAPRELVVRAWTECDQLAKWFGPKGSQVIDAKLDLRVGGTFHYGLKSSDGSVMWGRWKFEELALPERMVFVSSFSDPKGGLARAPFFDGKWPLETHSVVTFSEHAGIGKGTVVKLDWVPLRATAEELALFASMHDSMRGGWGGTFDQLDEHLNATAAAKS